MFPWRTQKSTWVWRVDLGAVWIWKPFDKVPQNFAVGSLDAPWSNAHFRTPRYNGQVRAKYRGSCNKHPSVDSNTCLHILCTYRYSQIHPSESFLIVNRMSNYFKCNRDLAITAIFVWTDVFQGLFTTEILWMTGIYCDSLWFLLM